MQSCADVVEMSDLNRSRRETVLPPVFQSSSEGAVQDSLASYRLVRDVVDRELLRRFPTTDRDTLNVRASGYIDYRKIIY